MHFLVLSLAVVGFFVYFFGHANLVSSDDGGKGYDPTHDSDGPKKLQPRHLRSGGDRIHGLHVNHTVPKSGFEIHENNEKKDKEKKSSKHHIHKPVAPHNNPVRSSVHKHAKATRKPPVAYKRAHNLLSSIFPGLPGL